MALPNPFQKLKHGALLCKKNFNTFVETFNFLVDFAQNIRGDGDANGSGSIVVDRSVPDRPVIRSKINMDYPFGGSASLKSCFEIRRPNGAGDNGGFDNPYYQIGTKTYLYAAATSAGFNYSSCIIGLFVSLNGGIPTPSIVTALSVSGLNALATLADQVVIPLYEVDGFGEVTCDFRSIPTFPVWEY